MKFTQALLHNTGWKMLAMLFTFLNNILIVRILGVEGSAVFFYALAIFILLSTVLKFGLENGIVYILSKKKEQSGSVLSLLVIVVLVQIVAIVFALYYFIKEATAFTLIWVLVVVLGNILVSYISAFYQVKKMFISLNIISTSLVLFQTLLLAQVFFFGSNFLEEYVGVKNEIDAILFISAIAVFLQLIVTAYFFYKNNRSYFYVTKPDISITKNIFSYSIINYLITLLFFLIMRVDVFLVEKYSTQIVLSNYLQATKIVQMLLVLPGLLGGVIFPFTIEDPKVLSGKVAYICRILTALYIIFFILFLIIGPSIFIWLLGDGFNLIYKIFAFSFLGVYCLSISLLLISYLVGIKNFKIILLSLFTTLLILVVADFLFIAVYGYLAAAIVFSISNLIGLVILLKKFIAENTIKVTDILIIKKGDIPNGYAKSIK